MINPFINNDCEQYKINKAPIETFVSETFAQCNEDLIIEALLRTKISQEQREMNSIKYVEIGANHPIQTSSTWLLHKKYGAKGLLVEANPELIETLELVRANDEILHACVSDTDANEVLLFIHKENELTSVLKDHINNFPHFGGESGITQEVKVSNLHINKLIEHYIPYEVDFFSIDIEGLDLQVLEAMSSDFLPAIIQVEHEGKFDDFVNVLAPRGYQLLAQTDVNAIFILQHK